MDLDAIEKKLCEVTDFRKVIVNAVDYADVKVFCVALYRAMAKGKEALCARTKTYVRTALPSI